MEIFRSDKFMVETRLGGLLIKRLADGQTAILRPEGDYPADEIQSLRELIESGEAREVFIHAALSYYFDPLYR